MAYVAVEIFQQVMTSLEQRLGQMEAKLTELFNTVDKKFVENHATLKAADERVSPITEEMLEYKRKLAEQHTAMEGVKFEVPQRLADIMNETKEYVKMRTETMESSFNGAQSSFNEAQGGFQRLQIQTAELRAEVNRVTQNARAGTGGGGPIGRSPYWASRPSRSRR